MAGITPRAVYNSLNRAGIICRSNSESGTKAFKHITQILLDFDAGKSSTKLAKEYKYSISGMSSLLKRNGRTPLIPQTPNNWEFINLRDELFYYWLGWMLADGCISYRHDDGRNRGITTFLTVQLKDKHIVDFFQSQIGGSIRNIKGRGFGGLQEPKLSAHRLDANIPREKAEIITQYGLIKNKTYDFQPTDALITLPESDFYQLLVGFTEGDGSTDFRKLKAPNGKFYGMYRIRWSGNVNLLNWVGDKLTSFGYKHRNTIISHSNKGATFGEYCVAGAEGLKLITILKQQKYNLLKRKWDL